MKRHASLIPLSHDHRQGLFLAQVIKRGVPRYPGVPTTPAGKRAYALAMFRTLLFPHFQAEQEVLAPLVCGLDEQLDGLLQASLHEHDELASLVAALGPLGDAGDAGDDEALADALHRLGTRLEAHIRTEERQLFQRIQAVVAEDVLHVIQKRLEKCQKAACVPSELLDIVTDAKYYNHTNKL